MDDTSAPTAAPDAATQTTEQTPEQDALPDHAPEPEPEPEPAINDRVAFMWLVSQVNAQTQVVTNMDIDQLEADPAGRDRFTRLHRRHRRSARKLVRDDLFEQLQKATPPLGRKREPSAAEIHSAYAGMDNWCRFLLGALQPNPAQLRAAQAASEDAAQLSAPKRSDPLPGHYL